MAAKFKKFITFAAVLGAICAAIYYFFVKDDEETENGEGEEKESEIRKFFEEMPSREYVPLNKNAAEADKMKSSIKNKIDESRKEKAAKAKEKAEGVGVVKEDVNPDDYEFEEFDESKDDKSKGDESKDDK
ncbi:MAG: hypothetical protein K5886_12560 [Lachnospiraceae bacterium]|nr:hypothetical protein [Lachnospiraceae bacterium]